MTRRRRFGRVLAVALAALLASPLAALAAPPDGAGGGGGGGGSDGGAPDTGDLYADLVLALRDVDGIPVLADFATVGEDGAPTTTYCVQPISYTEIPGITSVTNDVDGATVWPVPLMGELPPPADPEIEVEVCDPQPAYAMYISEVELERLNLARTTDDVIARKLEEVELRLTAATDISLDGAGRITTDGVAIDASPDHAAIYQALMDTGTIPGLPTSPAQVEIFGPFELAAAAIGTASGKEVPINVDTVEYYNQVNEIPGVDDPADSWVLPTKTAADGTKFVDYSGFTYNRADTFQGCVTWLNVPDLEWMVSPILDVVQFAELPDDSADLGNVRGFAQLADDVRATILYFHENEVIDGFFMDAVGTESCAAQELAQTIATVDLASYPPAVVQTETFPVSASLNNAWSAPDIAAGYARITVDAAEAFTSVDQITAIDPVSTQSVAFTLDGGNLVGRWGPPTGFPVPAGYHATTTFDVTIAAGAPTGAYALTLDLIDVSDMTSKAKDTGTIDVAPAELTLRWLSVPKSVTQLVAAPLTARVFNASDALVEDTDLRLRLHANDLATPFTAANQAVVYFEGQTIPFALDGSDLVAGLWVDRDLAAGEDITSTWWLSVAAGAPIGAYTLTFELDAPATLTAVAATNVLLAAEEGRPDDIPGDPPVPPPPPEEDGEKPPADRPPENSQGGGSSGYWLVTDDGAVYTFGEATYLGNATSTVSIVDLEPTVTGDGYWLVDSRGAVTTKGDAASLGDVTGLVSGELVTSLSATPSGNGYRIFTNTGRVFVFGDASWLGDMSGVALNGPVLDSVTTPSGNGYYMVASDGGVFTFGDAVFHGSMGAVKLNAPVQSLTPDPDGSGYWLVASDGGVFSFDAIFQGSMGATPLNAPVVGMVAFGNGYLMVASDGGIFNFSDLPFLGSLGDTPPARPIVSVAPLG